MTQQLPVFVYGTLRRGQCNHRIVGGCLDAVHEARLPAHRLYAHGLPYIAADPAGESTVTGDLLVISAADYAGALAALDQLEGFRPPDGGLYVRAARPVTFRVGQDGPWETASAWVYLGGKRFPYQDDLVVPGGDWLAAQAARYARA